MLEGIISLASYSYGSTIGDVLNEWAAFGAFQYILPFLLIFALIYGILNSMKIFKDNKAVDAIIALSVALMALQFEFVPLFFAEIFPRMGVALSIILVVLILAGFFVDPSKPWIMYSLLGGAMIVAVVVLVNTAGAVGWWSSAGWWTDNWPVIAFVVFILAAIGIIVGSANPTKDDYKLGPFRQ